VGGLAWEALALSGGGSVNVAKDASTEVDWVTVVPEEFPGRLTTVEGLPSF
jgi:hypothetical protein